MAKPEWGVKRACLACGARFYDMQKSPIVCPKCQTIFDPEAIFRPRRARVEEETPVPANDDAKKKAAVATDDDLDGLVGDDIEIEDDEEDDALETTDDLDDDDDVGVKPVGEDDD